MISQYFTICNGVRQGGILSPRLFALYVNQLTNKLIVCKAGCYFNDMCINHVLYADDKCLLAPSASAMQSLLDVCYEYGTDNDILFNHIKSVFKPKAYKQFTPTVFIGDDALRFTKEAKYLGFTFNDSKCLVIVHQTLKLLFFKAIVQHCVVLSCGMIIKSLHLVKFMSHLTMFTEKYLVSPSGVVLVQTVQCMQLIIFVTLRQCYVRTYMVLCKD